jgi:hypothetical protein
METEEFDRNIDEADDEPIEGSETAVVDDPAGTDETETTGSTDPGTVATPEGTAEVDEGLEDRGHA